MVYIYGHNGVWTKWYGQNSIRPAKWYTDKMTCGQNGIQTKWYTDMQHSNFSIDFNAIDFSSIQKS